MGYEGRHIDQACYNSIKGKYFYEFEIITLYDQTGNLAVLHCQYIEYNTYL
jgi:hypothetical protein